MAYTATEGNCSNQKIFIIPPTTDLALIFPLNHDTKKFDSSFYSSALTDGRASRTQIEKFLSEVEEKFRAKLKWLHWLKVYLLIALVTGLMTLLLYTFVTVSNIDSDSYQYGTQDQSYYTNHHRVNGESNKLRRHNENRRHSSEEEVDLLCVVWFGAVLTAIIWSYIFKLVRKYSFRRARSAVQEIVNDSQAAFADCGVRWNVPLAFPHYLELWKDYKGQSSSFGYNHNMINYNNLENARAANQVQSQTYSQVPAQTYPNIHQIDNPQGYPRMNSNEGYKQTVTYQAQRGENNYVPPYAIKF